MSSDARVADAPRRPMLTLVVVALAAAAAVSVGIMVTGALTGANAPIADAPAQPAQSADAAPPPASAAPVGAWSRPVVTPDGLADAEGIRLLQVAVTGGGGLLDVRFQVLDPTRAGAIHDPDRPPALVDDATSVVVDSLLMGHSHGGAFTAGQTYYLVFENPGNLVQPGGSVSVLLGDAELPHVQVH